MARVSEKMPGFFIGLRLYRMRFANSADKLIFVNTPFREDYKITMLMKTTNYFDTFIEVAADCPASKAEIPPVKENARTVANIHFDMVAHAPYTYTSDDVVFGTYAAKNEVADRDRTEAREQFFSKGQPCLRTSPLAKRYGWGIHSDAAGKVAIYPLESKEYKQFAEDEKLEHVRAMRSKKA